MTIQKPSSRAAEPLAHLVVGVELIILDMFGGPVTAVCGEVLQGPKPNRPGAERCTLCLELEIEKLNGV